MDSSGLDPSSSTSTFLQIISLVFLLFLSGFFSASETALISLSKIRLRSMVDEGVKNAKLIEKVLSNQNKLISSILVGNNLVNIGASALATSFSIDAFGSGAVGIVTGALTLLVLIFGEITPKTFATEKAEKVCLVIIKPIALCVTIFTPVVAVLNVITGVLFKILGCDFNKKKPTITESEFITMVNVGHEEGVIEVDEREMINNVIGFGDSDAKDIMVPRTNIIAVEINSTFDELLEIFKKEQFSRVPVYRENIDDIVGIISIKDCMFADNIEKFDISAIMRKPYFTYESKSCSELFSVMRTKSLSMAIILDEYGGTSGIVTLEDLLEEIVGDISDEFDDETEEIKVIKEDEFVVEGSAKISDVNEMLGTSFESEDFDSIGGYVVGVIGRFPEKGETIEENNIKFIIEETDRNRIEKMRILK